MVANSGSISLGPNGALIPEQTLNGDFGVSCRPICARFGACRTERLSMTDHDDDHITAPIKKVALIGAGCASLTVANDLRPLGYDVTIFEALDTTGGLMRTNIPQFRLPPDILDEEIDYILDMGVDLKLNHRIDSMKELLETLKMLDSAVKSRPFAETALLGG